MTKKITLLTCPTEFPVIQTGDIGTLLEYAPDSQFGVTYSHAIPIVKLIGHHDTTYDAACELVNLLLSNEPLLRGIPQLTVFQEQMNWEFHKLFRLIHLHDFLLSENYQVCEFPSSSWWGTALANLVQLTHSPIIVQTPKLPNESRLGRVWKRIVSSQFSLKELYTEFTRALDQLDPFHRRKMRVKKTNAPVATGKIWYYSTAVTFTNIGLLYEPYFPQQFEYLIENPLTGGQPLIQKRRSYRSIYDFARSEFIPRKDEIEQAKQLIRAHLSSFSLNQRQQLALNLFHHSAWFSLFNTKYLQEGLFLSSLFEQWIKVTKPAALVVGNPVFECYALFKAREFTIPTVLLQHGILGGCYKYYDHPVTWYIMRGQFWRESLSPISQTRTVVINPPSKPENKKISRLKKSIIFITSPLAVRYMPIDIDLDSILATVLTAFDETHTELIIRVHPTERVVDYQNKVEKIIHTQPTKQKNILYSQGGPFEELLNRATAVVMFTSTVFLDCIKHDVPVISFDWCDFWYKERVKSYHVYRFVNNLAELTSVIKRASEEKLATHMKNPEHILQTISADSARKQINSLLSNRTTPSSVKMDQVERHYS
jgi:hypothetical protein